MDVVGRTFKGGGCVCKDMYVHLELRKGGAFCCCTKRTINFPEEECFRASLNILVL